MSCLYTLYLSEEMGRLSDGIVTPTGTGQRAFDNKSMSHEDFEGIFGPFAQSSSHFEDL